MFNVQNAKFVTSCVKREDYPQHDGVEVVLLGRSNVGKSTFINKVCERKKLAYTSSKPGKTQTLNFFDINQKVWFVDVPGYGYAKVSKKQREEFGQMIENYLTENDKLIFAVLLVDFKVGPTEDDILMYNFLKFHQIKVFIIATKKDKIKRSSYTKQKNAIMQKMNFHEVDVFYAYSSEDKQDIINIKNKISMMVENNE